MMGNKPWRGKEKLRDALEGADWDYQQAAEELGCTPPTVARWEEKHEIKREQKQERQVYEECQRCGGDTPGPYNGLCNDCLDEVREQDSNMVET